MASVAIVLLVMTSQTPMVLVAGVFLLGIRHVKYIPQWHSKEPSPKLEEAVSGCSEPDSDAPANASQMTSGGTLVSPTLHVR